MIDCKMARMSVERLRELADEECYCEVGGAHASHHAECEPCRARRELDWIERGVVGRGGAR